MQIDSDSGPRTHLFTYRLDILTTAVVCNELSRLDDSCWSSTHDTYEEAEMPNHACAGNNASVAVSDKRLYGDRLMPGGDDVTRRLLKKTSTQSRKKLSNQRACIHGQCT